MAKGDYPAGGRSFPFPEQFTDDTVFHPHGSLQGDIYAINNR